MYDNAMNTLCHSAYKINYLVIGSALLRIYHTFYE